MKKASHVGAPAIFALKAECQRLAEAFGGYGCFLVGSSLERPDWRDVDVRLIMADEEFAALFPNAGVQGQWECNPRWLLMVTVISEHLRKATGLPVDFQFQPQSWANTQHAGRRDCLSMKIIAREDDE